MGHSTPNRTSLNLDLSDLFHLLPTCSTRYRISKLKEFTSKSALAAKLDHSKVQKKTFTSLKAKLFSCRFRKVVTHLNQKILFQIKIKQKFRTFLFSKSDVLNFLKANIFFRQKIFTQNIKVTRWYLYGIKSYGKIIDSRLQKTLD